MLIAITALLLPNLALANTGVSANAPEKSFYVGFGEDCCGEDPHPVHGIAIADGSYVVVGKSMDASGNQDGFILRFQGDSLSGTSFVEAEELSNLGWSATIGSSGNMDGLNNAASTANAILASGFTYTPAGTIDRYLVKYDLNTGNKIWEATFPDSSNTLDGAYESMLLTADGGLVLTGVMDAEPGTLEGFKSYGNPATGSAFLEYLSPAQINSDNAPQSANWLTTLAGANSGKGVRELPGGGFVVAALDDDEGAARAYRIDAGGNVVWANSYPNHGEVTDLTLLSSNGSVSGIALVGHYRPEGGGIDGSVTKISLDGEFVWHTSVGDPEGGIGQFAGLGTGNPNLIFDECWGIQGTIDGGMVLACGTGIEGCGEYSPGSPIHAECMADPRKTWRGYLVKLDQSGNEVWHRVDSFLEPGEVEAPDSASEYVALKADGSVVSIVDQGFGIGVLVLNPNGGNTPGTPSNDGDPGDENTDSNSDPEDDIHSDDSNDDLADDHGDDSPSGDTSDPSSNDAPSEAGSPSSGCSAAYGNQSGYAFDWFLLCLGGLAIARRRSRTSLT